MTPVELRRATVGYSDAAIRTAVVAGLLECPLPNVPADPHFADLVAFWLTDPESWEWFPCDDRARGVVSSRGVDGVR